jgi:hypothetical protein
MAGIAGIITGGVIIIIGVPIVTVTVTAQPS